MKNMFSTKNPSSIAAGYQHSGTEGLRSNEKDLYAPIISGTGPAKNTIAAAYQKSGTENLRGVEKDIHAEIISPKAGTTIRAQFKPSTVDSFKGNIV